MRVYFQWKKMEITDSLKAYAEKKLSKRSAFFQRRRRLLFAVLR